MLKHKLTRLLTVPNNGISMLLCEEPHFENQLSTYMSIIGADVAIKV
jgi:hypothetical protein